MNFNGKPETTKFISATQISATIPASDVATAGNMNVTVTNPASRRGDFAVFYFHSGRVQHRRPFGASLTSGQPSMIQITATPTANGFTNSISFSVSGLPAGTSASFNPTMLTLNGAATPTTLRITRWILGCFPEGVQGLYTNVREECSNPLLLWIVVISGGYTCGSRSRDSAHEALFSSRPFRTDSPDGRHPQRMRARRTHSPR